jgi:hypothetical protein
MICGQATVGFWIWSRTRHAAGQIIEADELWGSRGIGFGFHR